MSVGSSDRFRISIEDSYLFARDEVVIRIVRKEPDGYRPVTFSFVISDEVISYDGTASIEPPECVMPREIAELLLSGFGRHFLSSEGDLVATHERLKRELARVTKQLEDLIAGIGRLGGQPRIGDGRRHPDISGKFGV